MPTNTAQSGALKQRLAQHVDNIRNTPEPNGAVGFYTMVGLAAIIGFLGYHFGGFGVLFADFPGFLSGHALELMRGNDTVPTGLATIVVMMVASFIALPLVSVLAGKTKGEHAVSKELSHMQSGNQFGSLLFVVLLEEIVARGFFLGVLTRLPFLGGTTGFYAMFLLGNTAWALIHLTNFTNKEDRSIWRVMPQFISGVLITFVFVKYGFLAGFMVHLGFDAVLFATSKANKVGAFDVLSTLYYALVAGVCFYLMSKPLADVLVWFHGATTFKLAGWQFWDYFKAEMFLTYGLSAIAGVLLFDTPTATGESKLTSVWQVLLGSFIVTAALFGVYWAMGFVVHDTMMRVLLVGILFACGQKGSSGSSVARSFWVSIPSLFISLCVMEAMGFWAAMMLLMISIVISLPLNTLKSRSA